MSKTANVVELRDPRERRLKTLFKGQPQNAPGLDRKMDPVPDHSENGYQPARFLFGPGGLIQGSGATPLRYFRNDFHPDGLVRNVSKSRGRVRVRLAASEGLPLLAAA